MKFEPIYFVQTSDGKLHAYWDLDLLLCDLAFNGEREVKVLKRDDGGPMLTYSPVSLSDLKKEKAA